MTETSVGEMHKRREKMADERRYIIYYTFGDEAGGESGNPETMTQAAATTSEIENTEEGENV